MPYDTAVTIRPLTKSRFKLALTCPTQLYYGNRTSESLAPDDRYVDRNQHNDFLKSLADGGYQVGELARFKYHSDPVGAAIAVGTLDYEAALQETDRRLAGPPNLTGGGASKTVIAEAALASGNLFVRADIVVKDPGNRTLHLIEVKSKSVDADEIAGRFRGKKGGYATTWIPYLYDIAFQTLVARRVLEERGAEWGMAGWTVSPKLVLVAKERVAQVAGLHQHFVITGIREAGRERERIEVQTTPGLTAAHLGGALDLLAEVDVADIVADLMQRPVPAPHAPAEHIANLPSFVDWAAGLQRDGVRHWGGVSKTCKSCTFRAKPGEVGRSGVNECFAEAVQSGMLDARPGCDASDPDVALVVDLWGGKAGVVSMAGRAIDSRRAFLADVSDDDIRPNGDGRDAPGMSPFERRLAQIASARGDGRPVVLAEDALADMDRWEWPLHMIDFETTAPALPFFAGMRPYQTIAFQFSHHIMERVEGQVRVRHANQWISTQPGVWPNIEFVHRLRAALMPDGVLRGTVFRYHNHENTVLRGLRRTIIEMSADPALRGQVPDADELIAFIDDITHAARKEGGAHVGAHDMVDLHSLVERGYWSKHAGGSISLKYILPAILNDAPMVAERYSRAGVYGRGLEIQSLNIEGEGGGQVWLTPESKGDPYRTLPPPRRRMRAPSTRVAWP